MKASSTLGIHTPLVQRSKNYWIFFWRSVSNVIECSKFFQTSAKICSLILRFAKTLMQVCTLYICVATFPAQHFPKLRFYEFFVATRYPHQISAKYCLLKLMNQPSPVSKIDNRKKTSSSSIWPNVEPSRHTMDWKNFCRRISLFLP